MGSNSSLSEAWLLSCQGAPIQTYDIDLVYSREPANGERLVNVLQSLDAFFRIQP